MRCAIAGPHGSGWVEVEKPELNITRSDFDTLTATYERVSDDPPESQFNIGAPHANNESMFVTGNNITQVTPALWRAKVTYTGIYEATSEPAVYFWDRAFRIRSVQVYKPIEVEMRSYSNEIVEREYWDDNYILRIPGLTVIEKYVTKDTPDNSAVGDTGSPMQPPGVVNLPTNPSASNSETSGTAFTERDVNPSGWILNTRNWKQVLDNPLYAVQDEWIYQTSSEYVNVTPA